MVSPTIEKRLQRKYVLMTTDQEMVTALRAQTPPNWEMVVCTDIDDLGEWGEVLLNRFLLLDLDEWEVFDPIDVIRLLRMQYQINIPVFCFGGDEDIQDEMRISRADRFFTREEMLDRFQEIQSQFNW